MIHRRSFITGLVSLVAALLIDCGHDVDQITCTVSKPLLLPDNGIHGYLEWDEFIREQFSAGLCR